MVQKEWIVSKNADAIAVSPRMQVTIAFFPALHSQGEEN